MKRFAAVLLLLVLLHAVTMSVYLHRLPGLLGDEGSEGENVWEILDSKQVTIYGERSYIGPAMDYLRIPFVLVFGYNALALRIPIVILSVLTFFLAAAVFRKLFGEEAALYIVAALFFSPAYLLYQRLGWAITIILFFALFTVWLLQQRSPWKFLWAGLAAGIGLHNHFIFLPTLAALVITYVLFGLTTVTALNRKYLLLLLQNAAGALIGFAAGFSTQLAVLLTMKEDQGEPGQIVSLFTDRLWQLPEVLPKFISGSIFSAFYTGEPLAVWLIASIMAALVILIICGFLFSAQKKALGWWLLGMIIQLIILVLIIDRFAARYLIMTTLSVWGMAGFGLYAVAVKCMGTRVTAHAIASVVLVVTLIIAFTAPALAAFLRTGGSTAPVVITEKRSEPAAAFVDVRELLTCVSNQGPVYSDSVHIYNRLLYLSHSNPGLQVTENEDEAAMIVDYRLPDAAPGSACPELRHFTVSPN